LSAKWQGVRFAELLRRREPDVRVNPAETYQFAGVFSFGRGVFRGQERTGSAFSYDRLTRVRRDEFVYPKLMAWEGAFGVVPPSCDGCYVSPEFPVFEIDTNRLVPSFLNFYFKIPAVWELMSGGSTGTNVRRRRLNPSDLLLREIPLPPLAEQKRVVARIEELAEQIDEGCGLRKGASADAEALVAAHLNRLFGDPYFGRAGALDFKEWKKIDEVVTDVADGPHVTPTYVEEGIPFITVLNITSGKVRFGEHKFISNEDHVQFQKRAKAERGDVLITKDGTIGIPCIVDTDREFSFFVSVALIKPRRDLLDGEFLVWTIRAPYLKERILKQSRGDMIRHLVLREIRDLILPVPPLAEQRRIVAELENVRAEVEALRRLQIDTANELDALLPAVLDRAFKGEL